MIARLSILALAGTTVFFGLNYYAEINAVSLLQSELVSMKQELDVAKHRIAVQQEQLRQATVVQVELQKHIGRVSVDAERSQKKAVEISKKEGADEALNPYERAVFDSLLDK